MLRISKHLMAALLLVTIAGHSFVPPLVFDQSSKRQSVQRPERQIIGSETCTEVISSQDVSADRLNAAGCEESPACAFCFIAFSAEFPVYTTAVDFTIAFELFQGEGRSFTDRFRPPITPASV